MEPKTNTLLTGPNAPTYENLVDWIKQHPTFHVVMPKTLSTSKFYGTEKSSQKIKHNVVEHHRTSLTREQQKAKIDSKLKQYQKPSETALSKLIQDEKKVETPTQVKKITKQPPKMSDFIVDDRVKSKRQSLETSPVKRKYERSSSYTRQRQPSESATTPPMKRTDVKPVRSNARKGLLDALKTRVEKCDKMEISNEKLQKLVDDIEHELFHLYNKDVGSKYKAKYRSLVFNIKDEKNNGLFRKIVQEKILPKHLVAMTADDLANKELKEWRQAELKHDIEKIKSTELDKLATGEKFMIKSHKGDMVIEGGEEEAKSKVEAVLPEEDKTILLEMDKNKSSKSDRKKDKDKHDKDRHHKDRHHSSKDRHDSSKDRHHSSKDRHHSSKDRHHSSKHSSSSSSRSR